MAEVDPTSLPSDDTGSVKTAHVVFTPSGKHGDFPIGTPILQAARQLGVDINDDGP